MVSLGTDNFVAFILKQGVPFWEAPVGWWSSSESNIEKTQVLWLHHCGPLVYPPLRNTVRPYDQGVWKPLVSLNNAET